MKTYYPDMESRDLNDPEAVHKWFQELKKQVENLPLSSTVILSFITRYDNIKEIKSAIEEFIHDHLDRIDGEK
jgi:hypothetical protein